MLGVSYCVRSELLCVRSELLCVRSELLCARSELLELQCVRSYYVLGVTMY